VHFRQCTAECLPFPDDSFDVAVSRLGAMFFPDSLAACREMLRVTKPGGSLAYAVWHKSELNPFSYVVTDVMSRHVETAPPDTDALGAFRFAETGKLAGILTDVGAIDVSERIFKFDIAAPISPPEFWEMRSGTSETLRAKLAKLSEKERSQIAIEVEQAVTGYFPNNQMRFPAQMLIVTGKKPD
jgi:SAM-dependent methyltransferase